MTLTLVGALWCQGMFVLTTTGSSLVFSDGSLASSDSNNRLRPSRSYTLSLSPQIIYAQSTFLPSLVSSQIHSQLEFLAVGSWWIQRADSLQKIPSSREDVFADDTLSRRDKGSLMKLLRYVVQNTEDEDADTEATAGLSLQEALSTKFGVPNHLHAAILALSLSPLPAKSLQFNIALSRIKRHMRSTGYFGPGFGAVIPKYGGNAEIAQVACRAGAVGGAVYLLGHGVVGVQHLEHSSSAAGSAEAAATLSVTLSNGIVVRAKRLVGTTDDLRRKTENAWDRTSDELPRSTENDSKSRLRRVHTRHSVTIVADPLKHLFPQTSENGPVPAVAIILVDDEPQDDLASPLYLQVHSEDTGECPAGQCEFILLTLRSLL